MMASSQVEIPTSSPFHNRRDPCFQNNLNDLVTSCIPNDNPSRIDLTDLWVHHPQWQTTTTTTTNGTTFTSTSTSTSTSNTKCIDSRAKIDVRHHKDKWARAREIVFSDGRRSSANASDGGGSSSADQVCNSGCGGVSSLVQKWRGFEAGAKCCSSRCNSATASTVLTPPENINITNNDNAIPELPPPVPVPAPAPAPAPVTNNNNNDDDSIGDWESDRTALSGRSSFRGRDSDDATENERIRVADIIKRLTEDRPNEVVGSISPPRLRTSLDHQSIEQRCLSSAVSIVSSSPRIRGRQAYLDLLMKMERDRQKELERLVGRKAVSKFSHRGRIQALLRIRFLRRGMEAKEGGHSNSCKSSEPHKAMQSVVAHFREKANKSSQNGPAHPGSCHKELADNTPEEGPNRDAANQVGKEEMITNSKSCLAVVQEDHIQDVPKDSITSKQHNDHIHHSSHHEVNENKHHVVDMLHIYEDDVHVLHHEASSLSTFIEQQSTDLESCKDNNLGILAETSITFQSTESKSAAVKSLTNNSDEINEHAIHNEDEASTNHQIIEINYDVLPVDCAADHLVQSCCHDGESTSDQPVYVVEETTATNCWVSDNDVSYPEVGWEELHSAYQQQQEVINNNRDWIGEVSRPRCDWEDLRQARYQEMLDPFLDNEEIRVLLQRKSVSSFLSGDMRGKIDKLMISRSHQGQQFLNNNQAQEVKHEAGLPGQAVVVSEEGEREGEDGEDEQDEEGEEYGSYFDEYEEAESSLGQQYNGCDGYADHMMTSSPPPSWPQNQGHELTDYPYQVAHPAQPSTSNIYYSHDNGRNSSYNAHPAIEVELIYDLRRHMEQIHQEMSELRKSIKCCTDMQIKLQRSIKKEVAAALTHPDAENGRRDRAKKAASGGRCCVCCKVLVDCLLYRCGHICTCFKCAHELKWSSGKCPICRAPILDIVRTYSNFISKT